MNACKVRKTKVHGKKESYYFYLHEVLQRPIKGGGDLIMGGGVNFGSR